MQYIIHQVLESSRGIAEAEGHDFVFKKAVLGPEGGLPFLSWSYPEQMVSMKGAI